MHAPAGETPPDVFSLGFEAPPVVAEDLAPPAVPWGSTALLAQTRLACQDCRVGTRECCRYRRRLRALRGRRVCVRTRVSAIEPRHLPRTELPRQGRGTRRTSDRYTRASPMLRPPPADSWRGRQQTQPQERPVRTTRAGARRPPSDFERVDSKRLRLIVRDELREGRLESDGNGRARLRAGALPHDLVAAISSLELYERARYSFGRPCLSSRAFSSDLHFRMRAFRLRACPRLCLETTQAR